MRNLKPILLTWCLTVLLTAGSLCGQSDKSSALKVMSFNIRYGTANDGENRWQLRKENVVATIRANSPDVIGTQETLPMQAKYLDQQLTDYTYFGRSREDNQTGEQCGILFRTEKFDLLESGHFWLSETPNQPGSKSWDSSLPRMASWVKLIRRSAQRNGDETGLAFYFVNTHFDHRGQQARAQSAEVILKRIQRFETGVPVVLTGDFNAGPDSQPIRTLSVSLVDSYGTTHDSEQGAGTFGGFRGRTDGARIDYIFVSDNVKVSSASIDHRNFAGRDPSDHFPVIAELVLPTK